MKAVKSTFKVFMSDLWPNGYSICLLVQ